MESVGKLNLKKSYLCIDEDEQTEQCFDRNRIDNRDYSIQIPVVLLEQLESSDYYGGITNRSNVDAVLDRHMENPYVIELYGPYNYQAIAIRSDCENSDIIEVLQKLGLYPIIDEDVYYRLFDELIHEEWNDNIKREFIYALEEKLNVDILTEENVEGLFDSVRESLGVEWQESQDCTGVIIDVEEVVNDIDYLDLVTYNINHRGV